MAKMIRASSSHQINSRLGSFTKPAQGFDAVLQASAGKVNTRRYSCQAKTCNNMKVQGKGGASVLMLHLRLIGRWCKKIDPVMGQHAGGPIRQPTYHVMSTGKRCNSSI